jgi:hypothetical protein
MSFFQAWRTGKQTGPVEAGTKWEREGHKEKV